MPLPFDPIAEARRNWATHRWGATDQMVVATSITRGHQILLRRIDTALHPFGLNRLKRYSVNSRSSVVALGQPIGFPQGLPFADVNVQPPTAPRRFSLRLDV